MAGKPTRTNNPISCVFRMKLHRREPPKNRNDDRQRTHDLIGPTPFYVSRVRVILGIHGLLFRLQPCLLLVRRNYVQYVLPTTEQWLCQVYECMVNS